jgi:hypothetical protein
VRLGVVAAAAAAAAALVPAASANLAKPAVFPDPAGDAGTAGDLTSVSVTNDDAGLYRFVLDFAAPLPQDNRVFVYIDADLNASTGSPDSLGADVAVGQYEADQSFKFFTWTAGDWAEAPSSAAVTVAPDAKSITMLLPKADLAGSTHFDFYVLSENGDGTGGHFDDAPSGEGSFEYALQPTVLLSLVAATAYPPKAGRRWTLALVARRSDTGRTLGAEGRIACRATSGGTALALAGRGFVSAGAGSGALCTFHVPRRFEHRVLHGTISVSYHGQVVTRRFVQRVK